MFKRTAALMLSLLLMFAFVGCKKEVEVDVEKPKESSSEETIPEPEPQFAINPLTGVENLDLTKPNDRPVAITINNISVAQPVQTGLREADIVYETLVEGGITRLVALYQDISKIEKIGTVRSARYPFIDLAMGHNAIYVHHGQDSYHAGPHLNDIDRYVVSENNAGMRDYSNGLSSEHTLYAYGDKLWQALVDRGFNTVKSNPSNWVNFAEDELSLESIANTVTVPFSTSYVTKFVYNPDTKQYVRYFGDTQRTDYVTGQILEFKNIFVLKTSIHTYPNCTDGYGHQQVNLDSGDGYYCVNGTYKPIRWSKGASYNGFVFTNIDGTPLSVNCGNSWVCIPNLSANVTFG